VTDKISKVGQKGYSSTKWCQEVAISLFDSIFEARHKRKSGCIVSLDIKKAFDSISHNFMVQALRFFNFTSDLLAGSAPSVLTEKHA
jgi:hypothetical protein